jgi:hypothetical protein
MHGAHHAPCTTQHSTQHATRNVQHAKGTVQHATRTVQHATGNAPGSVQRATCDRTDKPCSAQRQ